MKDLESHGLKSNVKLKRCAFRNICSDSNRVKVNDCLSNCVFRELRRHIDSLLDLVQRVDFPGKLPSWTFSRLGCFKMCRVQSLKRV